MTILALRAASALLRYPSAEMTAALDEIAAALRAEPALPAQRLEACEHFIAELAAIPLLDAEERYVALFDRNRSLSLHLYEHVHGESRDRGQAMVRLATLYALHGLEIDAHELPDYLPLYLEFLSVLPRPAARSSLAQAAHVIAALATKLEARGSGYAAVLRVVEALAECAPAAEAVSDAIASLDPAADDAEALDAQWEEEAVRFDVGSAINDRAAAAACGR
jgi:nitrate reductase delta subunit